MLFWLFRAPPATGIPQYDTGTCRATKMMMDTGHTGCLGKGLTQAQKESFSGCDDAARSEPFKFTLWQLGRKPSEVEM